MQNETRHPTKRSVGIIGFGAFGQLIAQHIHTHFEVFAHDPSPPAQNETARLGVALASLDTAAKCDVVVLAMPVSLCAEIAASIAPLCRPGTLVIDVASVKLQPAALMQKILPDYVSIVATHPLFGPQSAHDGIKGLKMAICPIQGGGHRRLAAYLRKNLGLHVIVTTPEEHDREAATVQGLTHLIARVLLNMGPLPTRMTTRSFDLLMEAISMVQHDAPDVFEAIEQANPFAPDVRRRFLKLATELSIELEPTSPRDSF